MTTPLAADAPAEQPTAAARSLGATPGPSTIEVRAQDGARLLMRRYPGPGPSVLLLHGLAATSAIVDFPGRSLARWLAEQGFDVFVPEMRGHGQSEWPTQSWGMRDYLTQDLPAIFDAICATSGRDELHWVGHSMGGILLMCHAIFCPDPRLQSGLSIGSALTLCHGPSFYRRYIPLRPLFESWLRRVPIGLFYRVIAPLLGRGLLSRLERATVWPANLEGEHIRALHRLGFCDAPVKLLLDLVTSFEETGLSIGATADAPAFHFWQERHRLKLPLRMFAASRDFNVPADSVIATAQALNNERRLTVFGKASGCQEEYGHCDLVVGRHAETEVWPHIRDWLGGGFRQELPPTDQSH